MIKPFGACSWEEEVVYRDGFLVLNGLADFVYLDPADQDNIFGKPVRPYYIGIIKASESNPIRFHCADKNLAAIRPVNAPSNMRPNGLWKNEGFWQASFGLLVPYKRADDSSGEKADLRFDNPHGFRNTEGATSPATVLFIPRWASGFGKFHVASHVADSQLEGHLFHWLAGPHRVYSTQSGQIPKLESHIDLDYPYAGGVVRKVIESLEERFGARLKLREG